MEDKFLILEIMYKKTQPFYISIGHENNINKLNISFNDYFIDSDCGVTTLELEEGFLVQLYYKIDSKKEMNRIRLLYIVENHNFNTKDDPNNLIKHFLIDIVDYSMPLMPDFNFITFSSFKKDNISLYRKDLYFPKSKFSKKECEIWAHICLKTFVLFYKGLTRGIDYSKHLPLPPLYIEPLIIKNLLTTIKALDKNPATFFLEASIEFRQKRNFILSSIRDIKKGTIKKEIK